MWWWSAESAKLVSMMIYTTNWKTLSQLSHYIEIIVHPQSVNTTLNSTVNFTCEAVGNEISFRVNTMSAANKDIVDRGFIQQLQNTLSDGRKKSVIS